MPAIRINRRHHDPVWVCKGAGKVPPYLGPAEPSAEHPIANLTRERAEKLAAEYVAVRLDAEVVPHPDEVA